MVCGVRKCRRRRHVRLLSIVIAGTDIEVRTARFRIANFPGGCVQAIVGRTGIARSARAVIKVVQLIVRTGRQLGEQQHKTGETYAWQIHDTLPETSLLFPNINYLFPLKRSDNLIDFLIIQCLVAAILRKSQYGGTAVHGYEYGLLCAVRTGPDFGIDWI